MGQVHHRGPANVDMYPRLLVLYDLLARPAYFSPAAAQRPALLESPEALRFFVSPAEVLVSGR